jgi:hypothetical protein
MGTRKTPQENRTDHPVDTLSRINLFSNGVGPKGLSRVRGPADPSAFVEALSFPIVKGGVRRRRAIQAVRRRTNSFSRKQAKATAFASSKFSPPQAFARGGRVTLSHQTFLQQQVWSPNKNLYLKP